MSETIVVEVKIGVKRECGVRYENAVYWELDFGPSGCPVEDFFFDPPRRVPPDVLESIPHIGVHWVQRNGVWHLVDRVGLKYYPNPSDVFEETARLGLSRRLPKNLDFSRLTRESRLLLVHDRGWIENWDQWPDPPYVCPNHRHTPARDSLCCMGMWWEALTHAESVGDSPRSAVRHMATFDYTGRRCPDDVTPEYWPAFIASFPATRLAVIQGSQSAELVERVSVARVSVAEVAV